MESGALMFFCGYNVIVFMVGWFAHVLWSKKFWKVRGVSFRYADDMYGDEEQPYAEPGRYVPPPAYNPHSHEVVQHR